MAEKSVVVTKPKVSPAQFIKQVRLEVGKVTWPKRKEVIIATIMVFWMALIVTLFILIVDWTIQKGITGLFRAVA